MNRLGIVALLLGASVGVSSAGTFDWSGGYIGGQIGGRWAKNYRQGVDSVGLLAEDVRQSGVNIGAYAGYNHQFQNFVIGLEANAILSKHSFATFSKYVHSTYEANRVASINIRVGYAHDRILFYGVVGKATARYNDTNQYLYDIVKLDPLRYNHQRSGNVYGGGIEYALTEKLLGRLDYRFYDFGSQYYDFADAKQSFSQHAATLGIAYKF